jgi:RNA polymerase sigma-70 factor (ECF subfamily)
MNLSAQFDFVRWLTALDEIRPGKSSFLIQPVKDQETRNQDIELLQRVGARDLSAFAEFYDKYASLLFSIASRILHDASEAEDVLQETFVQIWEKADSFDPKLGTASSWAATLARNRSIDRIRASQRRARLQNEAGVENATIAEDGETANSALYGLEKAKLIQSALVQLPAEQRQPIEMAFFSGLTQHEISEKLGEPLGTIKARIRRGLLQLRDKLGDLL